MAVDGPALLVQGPSTRMTREGMTVSDDISNAREALHAALLEIMKTEGHGRKAALLIKLSRGWKDIAVSEHWDEEIAKAEAADAAEDNPPVAMNAQATWSYVHQGLRYDIRGQYTDDDGDTWMIIGRTVSGVPLMAIDGQWDDVRGSGGDEYNYVCPLPYVVAQYGLEGGVPVSEPTQGVPGTPRLVKPVQEGTDVVPSADPQPHRYYASVDRESLWRVAGTLDDGTVIMRDWHSYIKEWGNDLVTWDRCQEDFGPLTVINGT